MLLLALLAFLLFLLKECRMRRISLSDYLSDNSYRTVFLCYRTIRISTIETKAQMFRYRSLLSEQNQNVLIWSAYNRNKIGTFLFVPNSSVPKFIDPVLGMKMIVFVKISPKRSFSIQSVPRDAGLSLFWMRSYVWVVFKYWDCVECEIS